MCFIELFIIFYFVFYWAPFLSPFCLFYFYLFLFLTFPSYLLFHKIVLSWVIFDILAATTWQVSNIFHYNSASYLMLALLVKGFSHLTGSLCPHCIRCQQKPSHTCRDLSPQIYIFCQWSSPAIQSIKEYWSRQTFKSFCSAILRVSVYLSFFPRR